MIRIFILLLSAGIAVTGWQLAGPGGVWYREAELEALLAEQNATNAKLRERNEELSAELYSLQHQRDAIEERARRELYMVKADEVLFRLETPEEYEKRVAELASMPDYRSPDIKPGSRQTFAAKRGDLYHAPTNLRAPPSRGRRE